MAEFAWTIRRGSVVRRFADGLVLQGRAHGVLDLKVCRLVAAGSQGPVPFLGPLAAACASEGIRRDTGIISWLHWPDLVTIGGGVVARASVSADMPRVTFEVTVNCFGEPPGSFPTSLPRTSIREALGVEVDLGLLRDKVLHALYWYLAAWERGASGDLVERIRPTIHWLGRDVSVTTAGGETLRGRAKTLDEEGSLVLEPRGGGKRRVLSPDRVELVRLAD